MAVNVTKCFLPPKEEYIKYIDAIYACTQLTNQGPCVVELEEKLERYLNVQYLHYVANGTLALQLALRVLGVTEGEVITTPFSYVATTSSILWERCTPVFVDIELDNFTIDVEKIEAAITPRTKAIMAVHVFGYACHVERIQEIADRHHLKVIYDGAHAFGVKYKGRSLLDYGDISTLSFHATKLFHTTEGGACITRQQSVNEQLELVKRFGHNYDEHLQLGINAKNSELHAAMGLANFPYIESIIAERKFLSNLYDQLLPDYQKPKKQEVLEYNYAYYPILFESEAQLLSAFKRLNQVHIYPRRYFYPSLNKLPYVQGHDCLISEQISSRIACLPLYVGLEERQVVDVVKYIKG